MNTPPTRRQIDEMTAYQAEQKANKYRPLTYSLCMNVEGFMRNNRFPRGYDIFQNDDGTELTPAEALQWLTLEKAKGRKVIPLSSECSNPCKHADNGCTGFDYAGKGCPGRFSKPAPSAGTCITPSPQGETDAL